MAYSIKVRVHNIDLRSNNLQTGVPQNRVGILIILTTDRYDAKTKFRQESKKFTVFQLYQFYSRIWPSIISRKFHFFSHICYLFIKFCSTRRICAALERNPLEETPFNRRACSLIHHEEWQAETEWDFLYGLFSGWLQLWLRPIMAVFCCPVSTPVYFYLMFSIRVKSDALFCFGRWCPIRPCANWLDALPGRNKISKITRKRK